jgi:membrane protease subunit HflK
MAWNEPGKPDQDPWGSSGNNGGGKKPPRNDKDNVTELFKKVGDKFGGNGSGPDSISRGGIMAIIGVAATVWALSGIYIVDPAERGVVTRFGAYVDETKAGPHWHLPYPIESVQIVNVDQIRTAEIGYRSDNRNRAGNVPNESLMLTKDENIVDLKIAVQYQISNAGDYLYAISDPDVTLRSVTESALREVVGQSNMDFVLTEGRNEVVARVQELAQERLNAYSAGLMITSVNLQDAQPPEQVQAAFADVVKAREDRERLINEAEAYANEILPIARGKAARELEEASAYHDKVIAKAEGESARFTSIVAEYQKAPDVTRNRLYIDAVSNVLNKTSKVFVGSESSNNLMMLPLDKLISGQTALPMGTTSTSTAEAGSSKNTQEVQANSQSQSRSTGNLRDFLRNRELR